MLPACLIQVFQKLKGLLLEGAVLVLQVFLGAYTLVSLLSLKLVDPQVEGNPAESLLRLWVIEEVRFDHFAHNIQGQCLLIFVVSCISKKSFKDVDEIFSREDFSDSVDCVHFKQSLEAILF